MIDQKQFKSSILFSLKHKTYELIRTARLSSWMTASVFFLLGEWYVLNDIPFHHTVLILIVLGGLLSSASWINFVFDKELDLFAGEDTSFYRYISQKEMLTISIVISIISLFLLFYLSILLCLIGILIFLVGFFYSRPPLRLKIHPPLDCISNALIFGVLPALMGIFSLGYLNITLTSIVVLIISGFIVIAYFIFIGILDIETDKSYGIKTTIIFLGKSHSINFGLLLVIVSLIISYYYFGIYSVITVSLIVSTPFIVSIKFKNNDDFIRKILSFISLIWTESILLYMFVLSNSIIPLIIFIMVLLSATYFIYVYFSFIKKEKK